MVYPHTSSVCVKVPGHFPRREVLDCGCFSVCLCVILGVSCLPLWVQASLHWLTPSKMSMEEQRLNYVAFVAISSFLHMWFCFEIKKHKVGVAPEGSVWSMWSSIPMSLLSSFPPQVPPARYNHADIEVRDITTICLEHNHVAFIQ